MSLSPEELKKSLFSPATQTKKSPKRQSYDPINHFLKVYDYHNGVYSSPDTRPNSKAYLTQSQPFTSIFRSHSQPSRSVFSRTAEMTLGQFSKPDLDPVYKRIYAYESGERIAGALRKPVPTVAYVDPFLIKV